MKINTLNAIPVLSNNDDIVHNGSYIYQPYDAFDNIDKTYWLANFNGKNYLGYKFNNPIAICKYRIYMTFNSEHFPRDWTFEGSNDNLNWVVLDRQSNKYQNDFSANINNTNSYLYYRININKNNGGSYTGISTFEMYELLKENKYLLKQNNQYYTIKSEFYKNGNYKSITELEGKEILTENDFETFGIDDLNSLIKTIDTQVIDGIDKGNLGSGKYFEFELNNDIKKISDSDKIYSTEIIEDFQEGNKFNFDGRWQIITDSDSNIKNYLFSTPPGGYQSSNLKFKCKCKRIKFKYKLTYTSGHGSYSFTVDEQKLNIDCSDDWKNFEIQFDNDVEHKFNFSLNNDGYYTRLCIDSINVLTMTNKQLIQYNNTIYTLDGESIKLSPSQELNEDNFKVNGFNDATLISSEQWNKIFANKKNVKILMLTNDIEKQQCEMIYNCKPFRPIDKLKKNSDICNILFKEV
ncbi:hypothetical protein CBO05C_3150 [Clostridium botulinum B str. Osaka05]|uniref:F5/8 type C domain-containing protein n=1 Tax=Clostridium botulinum B str. Osaka05 TaxID=1407017 RepID=A0A0S6U896_CLOBO|nr:hypothetical protein [Clostridium botulinum]GAE03460.1 hypothetical protein CBO05C_3150 [Clostridium botulinum B str. Osaka05]